MSKHNKARKARAKIKMTSAIDKNIADDKPKKVSILDKELSKKQQIVFIATAITILIIGFLIGTYISGKTILDAQGFDSTDELITEYIDAFYNKDKTKLQRCYDLYSKDGYPLYNAQCEIATKNYKQTTIYPEKTEIQTMEYDNIDDIRRNTLLDSISASNMSQVTFEIDQIVDGITYTQLCMQRFITYERNNKWYLYAFEDSISTTMKATDKDGNTIDIQPGVMDMTDTQMIGNDITGYISIGTDWTYRTGEDNNNTQQMICTSSTGNSQISLITTDMYDTANDYAVLLYDQLKADDNYKNSVSQTNVKLNGYDAILINSVDSTSGDILAMWVFEAPTHDSKAHCITFECTSSEQYAMNYIATFKF